VAGFIGSPAMNLLDLPVVDGGVEFGDAKVAVERRTLGEAHDDRVTVGVRPEDLVLGEHGLRVEVDVVEELGADAYVYGTARLGGEEHLITARVDGSAPPSKGQTLHVTARPGRIHVFSRHDGHRLGM
jgi:multiple sugar transport system ATP-binding protein